MHLSQESLYSCTTTLNKKEPYETENAHFDRSCGYRTYSMCNSAKNPNFRLRRTARSQQLRCLSKYNQQQSQTHQI